jgi:uncharacterized membrane-anchored protein YhcB (DUF1043 family)
MQPGCIAYLRNPRVWFTLLLVFVCGVAAGVLFMTLAGPRAHNPRALAWEEARKQVTLERLRKELDLTPQQAAELEKVLDDFFAYYHTLQSQMDEVRATGKDRILRLLDERQRQKFEQMLKEFQAKHSP